MRRKMTPDEIRLWRHAMGEEFSGPSVASPGDPAAPNAAAESALFRPARKTQRKGAEVPGAIDPHEAKAIRRGKIPIEARLDLHGMTQMKAHAALVRFLRRCVAQGDRCVLVITGKGGQSSGDAAAGAGPYAGFGTGVLRTALPHWLESAAFAPLVVGSVPAQVRDGGDGARYVLLRRPARKSTRDGSVTK